jgi:hypothetical protein
MPSAYAIAVIKEHEAEPDREKRRLIARREYEKIGNEGDALIATMESFGMGGDETYRAFETEAISGIKNMLSEVE